MTSIPIMTILHSKNLFTVKCEEVLLLKSCVFYRDASGSGSVEVKPGWAAEIK